MEKRIFEKYLGKRIKVMLKPDNFTLVGYIDNVFDDCFEFRTNQKTSYIDFEAVSSLIPEK